jgi:single-stranded DNA-binding protein
MRSVVVGRVSASAYTRQDGEPGASLEVTADTVRFLGGRDLEGSTPSNGAVDEQAYYDESEIPF